MNIVRKGETRWLPKYEIAGQQSSSCKSATVPLDLYSEKLPITHSIVKPPVCDTTLPLPFKLRECL
jgi:hypothetical protein